MRLSIFLCAFFTVVAVAAVKKEHVTCKRTFKKIGCFSTVNRGDVEDMEMLLNDRDVTSPYHDGYLLSWEKFEESTHSLACRCAKKAKKKGYTYFSIRYWGECWGGKDYSMLENNVLKVPKWRSSRCSNPKFKACNDLSEYECVGKSNADYIYNVNGGAGDENVDGGYSQWSEFTECSVTCGEGIQERERSCTKPLPKGAGKDCSELGKSSEMRSCKKKACPIHGGLSLWTEWLPCSKTCGGGVAKRVRSCTNPRPSLGGNNCEGSMEETKECGSVPCPVNGGYSQWEDWGKCSAECGEGTQSRQRKCTNPASANGGDGCDGLGDKEESRTCKDKECPVDGGFDNWSKFSPCTKTCGTGSHMRVRLCVNPEPAHGGKQCEGETQQIEECNTDPCPVDGGFSDWGAYSKCSVSCGGGVKARTRSCTNPRPAHGGEECKGPVRETAECNKQECPINGGFTDWTGYSSCNKACGGGSQSRSRTCINPRPQHGGKPCSGATTNTRACNIQPCPVHGRYSSFGAWSKCTKSCGSGTQRRSRTCNNPEPKHGGRDCSSLGSAVESRLCETQPCPVHGGFTAWTGYGRCNKACGGGSQSRSRTCTNPRPQHGGKSCSGATTNTRACNIQPCPVDGKYSSWSAYGACSKRCGGGVATRRRTCTNPRPAHGGKGCLGRATETKPCNTHNCPVDGNYGSWSSWSKCTKVCGTGVSSRSRSCSNPAPRYGGRGCVGASSQTKTCNSQHCPVHGGWSSFGSYGPCNKPCGGGIKKKMRYCNNPTPKYGGTTCPGSNAYISVCNTHKCPIDGGYSSWSRFGACSRSCAGGTMSRSRTCNNPSPRYGGRSCSRLGSATKIKRCNTQSCPVRYSSIMTKRECEGRTLHLNCGSGKIEIQHANYGRRTKAYCRTRGWWPNTNCGKTGHSINVVRGRCQNRQSCWVSASNRQFGDPCFLTKKYLEVNFRCRYGG